MGDSNAQLKERHFHQCNGQATIDIPRSTRFILLLLVRSCLYKALPDCVLSRNGTGCAATLVIIHADRDWQSVEGIISIEMATIGEYLHTWKLKLSTTKTVPMVFHLNKEVKRELKVNFNNETLPICSEPKYLDSTLDRTLTYRRHLVSLREKLTSRVALFIQLADSGWGPEATTLQTATLTLVHSTTEYCAPAWRRSAHTRLFDLAINDDLRTVIRYLRSTLADKLPILAGIQPAELRRKGAMLSLARYSM